MTRELNLVAMQNKNSEQLFLVLDRSSDKVKLEKEMTIFT